MIGSKLLPLAPRSRIANSSASANSFSVGRALSIGNNDPRPGPATYSVSLEGPPGAVVLAPAITVASAGDRTVPVVVRLARDSGPARSIPFRFRISSGREDRVLQATFMTPGRGAGEDGHERN